MKPSLLIVLLVFGGIAAFAMLRREPVPEPAVVGMPEQTPPPVEVKAPEPVVKVEPAPKPNVQKNRFTGPHDGSHLRQGFNCPACAYKPLEY